MVSSLEIQKIYKTYTLIENHHHFCVAISLIENHHHFSDAISTSIKLLQLHQVCIVVFLFVPWHFHLDHLSLHQLMFIYSLVKPCHHSAIHWTQIIINHVSRSYYGKQMWKEPLLTLGYLHFFVVYNKHIDLNKFNTHHQILICT